MLQKIITKAMALTTHDQPPIGNLKRTWPQIDRAHMMSSRPHVHHESLPQTIITMVQKATRKYLQGKGRIRGITITAVFVKIARLLPLLIAKRRHTIQNLLAHRIIMALHINRRKAKIHMRRRMIPLMPLMAGLMTVSKKVAGHRDR